METLLIILQLAIVLAKPSSQLPTLWRLLLTLEPMSATPVP